MLLTSDLNETTHEIDYRECDTITIGIPKHKRRRFGWMRVAGRVFIESWDRVWPALLGVLLGTSLGSAIVLLTMLWWLNA